MIAVDALEPHNTASGALHLSPVVGIDLFDDEADGISMTAIYRRFADGTRWFCRTVNMEVSGHADRVIGAWALRGPINDFRK